MTVEAILARFKDHRVLRDCRARGPAIDHIIRAVSGPHNLKLKLPAQTPVARGLVERAAGTLYGTA